MRGYKSWGTGDVRAGSEEPVVDEDLGAKVLQTCEGGDGLLCGHKLLSGSTHAARPAQKVCEVQYELWAANRCRGRSFVSFGLAGSKTEVQYQWQGVGEGHGKGLQRGEGYTFGQQESPCAEKPGWAECYASTGVQYSALCFPYVRRLPFVRDVLPRLFEHMVAVVAGPVSLDGSENSFGARVRAAWGLHSNVQDELRERREWVARLPEF